jgi:hypothetical protein
LQKAEPERLAEAESEIAGRAKWRLYPLFWLCISAREAIIQEETTVTYLKSGSSFSF